MNTDEQNFDDAEFQAELDALRDLTGRYREEVLETLEPSPAYRASMHKMTLALVREEVLEAHRASSLSSRLRGRLARWRGIWAQLSENSMGFRLASGGALALGCGLVAAVVINLAVDSSQIGAQEKLTQPEWQPIAPIVSTDSLELDDTKSLDHLREGRPLSRPTPKGR